MRLYLLQYSRVGRAEMVKIEALRDLNNAGVLTTKSWGMAHLLPAKKETAIQRFQVLPCLLSGGPVT